jgi:hypothetical protein
MISALRIPEVDEDWIEMMRQSYEGWLARHLAAIPNSSEERLLYAWNAVAGDYRHLAFLFYSAGESLDRVRSLLVETARAHLMMASLRGGENGDSTPNKLSDYSTGNSRDTYLAICMALTAGELDIARSLAPLVWDPADARYVGPRSALCADKQQALAYTLKYLLLDQKDQAEAQIGRLTIVERYVEGEFLTLSGLVRAKPRRILDGISAALDWHARQAAKKENYRFTEYFLCLPALGLAAYALRLGMLTYEQLPGNNIYFPRDLIAIPAPAGFRK